MEPTYDVPPLFMALRIVALACVAIGVAMLVEWWRLRATKRPHLREKRRQRGLAALVLLSIGIPLFAFAPYEVKQERLEPIRTEP